MNHIKLPALNHWIFDMDGTLTVARHDFPFMRRSLGMVEGDLDILAYLARQTAADRAEMNRWLWDYEVELAQTATAAAGAVDLVHYLHKAGRKLAILTRNERTLAMTTLEAIGVADYFPHQWILGRDEAAPKPSGDGIVHLLKAWQADAADAVMVGDYEYDVRAGRAAGTHTVLVRKDNPWQEWSDAHFGDCRALLHALQTNTQAVC